MDTKTIDKLFLELSQITSARTRREIKALSLIKDVIERGVDDDSLYSLKLFVAHFDKNNPK